MIYLDNAATSYPKPPEVFAAMERSMRESGGNPGRSGHRLATAAEAGMIEVQNAVARFFGLSDPARCIFTLNCTDSLNIALKGVLRPGDHVVSSVLEHNSVNRPLQRLADEGVIGLHRVGMAPAGDWRVEEVLEAIRPQTRLVALTHCSNVLGVLCPVEELGKALRERYPQVFFLVDAAQTSGLVPLHLEDAGIDLLAFPGHKGLLGPTGTGALLIHPRIGMERFQPWREGGTGGDSASPHQPRELPHFLVGGTPNTMGLAGLLAGLRFQLKQGPLQALDHERKILGRLLERLGADERFQIQGTRDLTRKAGVLSITLRDRDTAETATILDQAFEICVRPGLHCAPYAHRALGTFPGGTLRLSPGQFNTLEEADQAVDALREIAS